MNRHPRLRGDDEQIISEQESRCRMADTPLGSESVILLATGTPTNHSWPACLNRFHIPPRTALTGVDSRVAIIRTQSTGSHALKILRPSHDPTRRQFVTGLGLVVAGAHLPFDAAATAYTTPASPWARHRRGHVQRPGHPGQGRPARHPAGQGHLRSHGAQHTASPSSTTPWAYPSPPACSIRSTACCCRRCWRRWR